MKSRDTLIRLKRFQLEEKRRRVRQIETMLAEFTRMIGDLDREIANEEKRAGITDPRHFAYPTYARATSVRRDNLKSSIAELAGQIEDAKAAQEEAQANSSSSRRWKSATRPTIAWPKPSRGPERGRLPVGRTRSRSMQHAGDRPSFFFSPHRGNACSTAIPRSPLASFPPDV